MGAEPGCFTQSHPAPDRYAPPVRDEAAAIGAVLAGGMLSGGAQVVTDYESALAARFGVAHAIAVNSGSSALHAVLHVLGARPGTEVLVPATASLPTAFPILSAGATPVITDVAAEGLGLDPQDVARKLTSRTVAAISLPLWGYPAAVTPAAQVLAEGGIPVVEDAAQAHGTLIGGRHAGTLGTVGCFSTHDRKLLATGEGGFILTDDDTLADKIDNYTRLGHLAGREHGVNYKLAAPLAAIGLRRLARLGAQITARTSNARAVLSALPADGSLTELALADDDRPNYYCLVLRSGLRAAPRIAAVLASHGLAPDTVRWHYQGLHNRHLFAQWASTCPHADTLIATTFQIPVHPGLDAAALQCISRAVQAAASEEASQ
jgi:perosamine synthetase